MRSKFASKSPPFFPPGVLHHCIRKEKNQNKTQICQVKHLKSFHEWIIGGGVSVFKVWQQPKKRKKKEGCCDSDKLQETEAAWTTNEILIFTTDRAATICLISPKIKKLILRCVSFRLFGAISARFICPTQMIDFFLLPQLLSFFSGEIAYSRGWSNHNVKPRR